MKILDVKAATEAVTDLPAFFDSVTAVIQTPGGMLLTAFAILYLGVFKNSLNFAQVFGHRKRIRLATIEKYLSSTGNRTPDCAAALLDMYEAEIFRVATGIYAEKSQRSALIRLHAAVEHRDNWLAIRFARPNIVFDRAGGATIREFNAWDTAGLYYNWVMSFLALCGAGSMVALLFLLPRLNWEKASLMVVAAVVAVFAAFVAALQNRPHIVANRIREELAKIPTVSGAATPALPANVGNADPAANDTATPGEHCPAAPSS